jgi:LmbE family N-acetylglucosaminyl deacetylase
MYESTMGATAARRWLGATILCALVAAVALVGDAALASSGCTGGSLYVIAHADDSILFQNPDLQRDIAAGLCVRTVVVTAGDAGDTSTYWLQREAGLEAAYAEMAGAADAWAQTDVGVAAHPMPLATLTARPNVSIVFMRLADGNSNGSGFGAYGFQSLQKLWQGTIGSITADDGSSSYTKASLTATLAGLMISARPNRVLTQDYLGSYGDGDHSDHHTVAFLVQAASQQYAAPHLLNGYRGYPISSLPANLDAATTQTKQAAWFAYAPYDA